MSDMAARLQEAIDERKRIMDGCPVNNGRMWYCDRECPKCGASSSGPCWENVRADAIVVDAVKALLDDHLNTQVSA